MKKMKKMKNKNLLFIILKIKNNTKNLILHIKHGFLQNNLIKLIKKNCIINLKLKNFVK